MKLVGFGCSFTYGSELIDPDAQTHHANTRYRQNNVWLGRLAKNYQLEFDNLAEPANSNFAIAQQVSSYILNTYNTNDKIIICVAWTSPNRMSWYDKKWTHNGFADRTNGWIASAKDWTIRSTDDTHKMYTDNAKLIVNCICKAHSIPIIQFNALGDHSPTRYPAYFMDGDSMDNYLHKEQLENSKLNLFAKDNHPNEEGHEYFTIRLTDFVKDHIIVT